MSDGDARGGSPETEERARGGRRDTRALRDARGGRADPERAASELLSGEAWRRYCRALEEAGDHLLAVGAGASEATRAEGIRYLLGLVKGGLGQALELGDPWDPRLFRNPDSTSRWGAENADNQYLWARIDPRARYRISGTRGSAFDFLIEVKEGYMQLGDERNFATLTADEIPCDAQGRFEIHASVEPPARSPEADTAAAWLPLDPDARYLAIRQYFCDWQQEEPAHFSIECLDAPEPGVTRADEVAARLQDAADWTLQTARTWSEWTDQLRDAWSPDRIAPARKFAGGADDIYYGNDFYRLAPDEAMLIETELPDARYWQFQLCDLWFRSADWSRRSTSINCAQAHVDEDGRFRCVIAHRDPGVRNWLDTGGEGEGLVQYRWIWSRNNPHPRSRILPFDRVRDELPASTPSVSPEDRKAEVEVRRRHREVREPAT
jgi:hypothetical protein